MPECQDVIYSNDYVDLIVNYSSVVGRELFEESVCQEIINLELAVIHAEREQGEEKGIRQLLHYQSIPRVFGLLDTSHFETTGVS